MKELTKAEEQVMQILWKIEKGFVKDLLDCFNDPKPAYNTVSTIIRILESKGFIAHKAFGKTHEYYPLISQQEYVKSTFKNFLGSYFSNSFHKLVSFFANDKEIDINEMEQMLKLMQDKVDNQKDKKDE